VGRLNTIVDRLLNVDREARRILDDAQQYHERMQAETQAEMEKLLRSIEDKAESHIRKAREAAEADAAEAVERIRLEGGALAQEMEAVYKRERLGWQEQLLARCIGR